MHIFNESLEDNLQCDIASDHKSLTFFFSQDLIQSLKPKLPAITHWNKNNIKLNLEFCSSLTTQDTPPRKYKKQVISVAKNESAALDDLFTKYFRTPLSDQKLKSIQDTITQFISIVYPSYAFLHRKPKPYTQRQLKRLGQF